MAEQHEAIGAMVILDRSAAIGDDTLRGLHPNSIEDPAVIRQLLRDARASRAEFHRGLNHRLDRETATIAALTADTILLETSGFRRSNRRQVFLGFELGHRRYFFASAPAAPYQSNTLEIEIPRIVFTAERRDRVRRKPPAERSHAQLCTDSGLVLDAQIVDESPGGLGIRVKSDTWRNDWRSLRIVSNELGEFGRFVSVRSIADADQPGWKRLGLVESTSPKSVLADIQRWPEIPTSLPTTEPVPESCPEGDNAHPHAELVRFEDKDGRSVAGFLDRNSYEGQPTAVILQTGWGETKEALLPLARTIVETFSRYREPVAVLRIDGVNQRGESYKDPDCRLSGREYNRFVFSQPVRDLEASRDFLARELSPKRAVLVSQSIAALAGRKFVARDRGRTVDGWVCVVGTPDLQSASRAISGGIDFAVGYESGLEFGYQELLGVMIHADRMMADAIDIGVLHIDDARKDFSDISIPVSWYHGQFDAWVDPLRVEEIMSFGDTRRRRIVHLPVAHRLGWSKAAFETFGVVANEVSTMTLGRSFAPARLEPSDLSARRSWERERRPKRETNLRTFWKDYLVGRDESVGFELMTACDPYEDLMAEQIDRLALRGGDKVLDLGCGTGALARSLVVDVDSPKDVYVVGLDLVPAAIARARNKVKTLERDRHSPISFAAADLDLVEGSLITPLKSGVFDSILASLFLSYVERPSVLLRDAYRLLRPGGRIVVSSLLKDADISRLYTESLAELALSGPEERFPELRGKGLDLAARDFLNDASRILEMESQGSFTFWDGPELVDLLKRAGFVDLTHTISFGFPGQAAVASGVKAI